MKNLKELLAGLDNFELVGVDEGVAVTHLTHDSREVLTGGLFFAIKGHDINGEMFAINAVARGAVTVVVEERIANQVPQIIVPNVRRAMSLIAKAFYNNVADDLTIVGITGTNGKTTTAHVVSHILRSAGFNVGTIGTLGATYGPGTNPEGHEFIECELTTPDPIQLHRMFKFMYGEGVRYIVMEASAHAIHLDKLAGINFQVGVFTNLSQDHLDFFRNYRHYADTKVNWFDENIRRWVVNVDDMESALIQNRFDENSRGLDEFIAYSIDDASKVKFSATDTRFKIVRTKFRVPLVGRFNLYNILASINVALALGLSLKKIRKALKSLPAVPGRFNAVRVGKATAIVDYAHTPDSLENVIKTCRDIVAGTNRKIITVFGCGGNRDREKRPKMGMIAGKLSDRVVITSDNPRTEPPLSIMKQIEAGAKLYTDRYTCIEDRTQAVHYALSKARPGDIVLIAGKGAEPYMDIGGRKIPYSDYEVINLYNSTN